MDDPLDVRRSHVHEYEPRSPGYTRETTEYTVRDNQCVALGIQGPLLNLTLIFLVVLTTIWVELMSDPRLFKLRQKVASRDHKALAAFALFVGGFCSRALLGHIGSAGTLGIGAGFRILVAFSWIFVPGKTPAR